MAIEKMSKQDEKRLIQNTEDVIELVNNGLSPTEAVIKVASDANLSPTLTQRMLEAYNQSRTLYELSEKKGSARLESFPIANPTVVGSRLFPDSQPSKILEKTASVARGAYNKTTENYIQKALKPQMEKQASDCGASVVAAMAINKAKEKHSKLAHKKDTDALSNEVMAEQEKLSAMAHELGEKIGSYLLNSDDKFHEIEISLKRKFGPGIDPIIKMAFEFSKLEKFGHRRAQPHEIDISSYTLADFRSPAHGSIENVINSATSFHKKAQQLKRAKLELGQEKQAVMDMTAGAAKGIASVVGGFKDVNHKMEEEALNKAIGGLQDPKFRDHLNQIKVQAMLHDFMSNDDVISTYGTNEVVDLFNQLYDVAPEAASKPAVMRDLLRRGLVNGGIEALEVGQLGSINKDLGAANKNYSRKEQLESLGTEVADIHKEPPKNEGIRMNPPERKQGSLGAGWDNLKSGIGGMFNLGKGLASKGQAAIINTVGVPEVEGKSDKKSPKTDNNKNGN